LLDHASELAETCRPMNLSTNIAAHLAELIQLFVNSESHSNRRFEGTRKSARDYSMKWSDAASLSTRQVDASLRQMLARFGSNTVSAYFNISHRKPPYHPCLGSRT
jgi:hypothetical protein